VVRLGSKGGWRRQFSTTLPDVQHWTWLDQHTIGLVTDKNVFHWLMEEGRLFTSFAIGQAGNIAFSYWG